MADTPIFPTAESVRANASTPSPSGAPAPSASPAPLEPIQPRSEDQRWEDEGGSNARLQPPAKVALPVGEQARIFVLEHPLLAVGIAATVGAMSVAALNATFPISSRPIPGSRRASKQRRALLDEVHRTTQAILRAVGERTQR